MQQIVQEVEIAEALLGHYLASLDQVDVASTVFAMHRDQRLSQEALIGSADQVYPEIWNRLDAARAAAESSGRDLTYYDQIRNYVGADAANGIKSVITISKANLLGALPMLYGNSKIAQGNEEGVRAARNAIATFRSVFPDLSWHTAAEPVPELRNGRRTATLLTLLCVVIGIAAFIVLR